MRPVADLHEIPLELREETRRLRSAMSALESMHTACTLHVHCMHTTACYAMHRQCMLLLAPLKGLVFWAGQGGCDHLFGQKTLGFNGTLAEVERDMHRVVKARQRDALIAYGQLASTLNARAKASEAMNNFLGRAGPTSTLWPTWSFLNMSDSLVVPTSKSIRTILVSYHRLYKPMLLGDLVRRSPGRCCSTDATFKLMIRTISEGKALVLFLGETRQIVAYFVVEAESWELLADGCTALRNRLERLGTLEKLEAWWDDCCCNGANDVRKHQIVTLFHGSSIWRAPYKDFFHRLNGVTKTCDEGMPIEKSEFGNDLSGALREYPQSELAPAAKWVQYKGQSEKLCSDTMAMVEVCSHQT